MSVPAGYTASTLAAFMHTTLGRTASIIGWENPASYAEPINDALLTYGVDVIADATDVHKLRACARWAVWQAVADSTTGYHDFSEDQQSFRMHQVHLQAKATAKAAAIDAARFGVGPSALTVGIENVNRMSPFEVPDVD